MSVATSGVYGEATDTAPRFLIGGGLSTHLAVSEQLSVGIQYRMYQLGDDEFTFEEGIPHGFSSSLFYGASSGEVTYRF